MSISSRIEGNENIVIQNVTDSTITVKVGGETKKIERKLETLLSFVENLQQMFIQSADKIYNVANITQANFDFILKQVVFNGLPKDLKENVLSENIDCDITIQKTE